MLWTLVRILLVGAAFLGAGRALAQASTDPLPKAEWLTEGRLDNGLSYLVKHHSQPPGRVLVWLHVDSGSLNEKESQRGLAHFLEHMAFNGSENFAPGTVVPFFESLGMVFGRHQNAFTNFDQTTYQLTLPDARPETLDKGMLFLSDVAFRLTLPAEEIESERKIILEERRRAMNGERRVSDAIMKNIAPGSIVGERLTIGDEKVIESAPREEFLDYYRTRYVASNMTLIVVGDVEPDAAVAAVRKAFGSAAAAPKPADQDAAVAATRGVRALVVRDDEISRASVSMLRVAPARPPVSSVGDWRRRLIERVAITTFNRRLTESVALGRASFIEASARSGNVNRAMLRTEVAATCEPESWKKALAELGTEVTRARTHGFTSREIADARKQMEASSRRAAETEATKPTSLIISLINQGVNAREPVMSAAQELDLGLKMLESISDDDVSRAFAELFDFADAVFVAAVPGWVEGVSDQAVLEAAGAALGGKPVAHEDRPRAASLLEHLPSPGTVGPPEHHVGASVDSMWLSNGARAHFRFMDYKHRVVTVTITLAGGELLETAETRGIAKAAAVAWAQPAAGGLSTADVSALMTGRNLAVVGRAEADALTLRISGAPEQIEAGLQLAYLLLTDPKIEPAAWDKWKQRQLIAAEQMDKDPVGRFARLLADTVYPPGELRPRPLTREQIERLDRATAEKWLRRQIVEAPIEVSVVGDITFDRAADLLADYIASLPARARISSDTFEELRIIPPPTGEKSGATVMQTETPKAQVMAGFFGPDASNVLDSRLLSLAERVLTTRMAADLREKQQLVYSIRARATPGVVFPGYGMFFAAAPTDPARAQELPAAIDAMYATFAKDGPTPEELETVRKQVTFDMTAELLEPAYWTSVLRDMDYRGTSLDNVTGAPAELIQYPAKEIKDAFARYYEKGPKVKVVVGVQAPPSGSK